MGAAPALLPRGPGRRLQRRQRGGLRLGSLTNPLVTGRLRTFLDLGDFGALQLGASVATGAPARPREHHPRLRRQVQVRPRAGGTRCSPSRASGSQVRKVKTPGEVAAIGDDGEEFPGTPGGNDAPSGRLLRLRRGPALPDGWLSRSRGLPLRQVGVPDRPGRQWAVEPYLTFMPSEFLRFRLGYKHTQCNAPGCCRTPDFGSARDQGRDASSRPRSSWARTPSHPF